MSMFNDIAWGSEDVKDGECSANSLIVGMYAKKSALGHWSLLGPGSETKWNNTLNVKPGGQWNDVAELTLNKFQESITQYFVQLVLWNEEL